jgi:hypothetical protein
VSGYVRIHRSLIGHPAFRNDAEAMAFAWMIARACWKPERLRYKGHGQHLNRGQLAISQRDMAHALDRDKAWIERLWKRLKSEAMIVVGSEAGVAVITICNYDQYQPSGATREAVGEALDEAFARQAQGTEERREEGNKEESEAKASHGEILSAWNGMADKAGLPKVRVLNNSRKQALRLREKEVGRPALLEAIRTVGTSDWLCGKGRDGNWRPTIDFILQPSSLVKVLEGAYGGVSEAAPPTRQLSQAERDAYAERMAADLEKQGRTADAEEYRRRYATSVGGAVGTVLRRVANG